MRLQDPVTSIPLVGPNYAALLKNLEIYTVSELLYHIPSRYVDFRHTTQIQNLKPNEAVTITGQIVSFANIHTKKGKLMQVAQVSDGNKKISVLWFNQPFIARVLPEGTQVSLSGKVTFWQKKLVIFSPQYEKIELNKKGIHTGRLIPIYHETAGVSSKWLRSRINYVLNNLDLDEEYFSQELYESIKKIHLPSDPRESQKARDRLAFDELLQVQVENNLKKITWKKYSQAYLIKENQKKLKDFINSLPFELTPSQVRSIDELAKDLVSDTPMNRLLEGDVGSGKTVVAAAGIYLTYLSGYKSTLMAPTQILAGQHFITLKTLLEPFGVSTALLTGQTKENYKKANLVVGTHALISKGIVVKNVAFVVVDEQHRFGVKQRGELAKKAKNEKTAANTLTMTATPIPRTIALTLYGDLDLSTLDEMPKGRQKVTTWTIPERKRLKAFKWIAEQISIEKTQVFVVCPLIEESESEKLLEVKSVKIEIAKVKKLLPKAKVGLLHGQMKAKEKDKVLAAFKNKKYDVLVCTPVVEVGIDIPNATVMVIETAERFGLAQLHQLRGRVGRSDKKSYCLLFTQVKTPKAIERLEALTKTHSGRELAELDLKIRGVGEIFGTRQSGRGDLKIATWQDIDLIKKTRDLALEVVNNPKKYKKILEYYKSKQLSNT